MKLFSLLISYVVRDTIRSKALLILILTVLAAASTAILLTLGVLEGFRTMLIEGERGWIGDVIVSPRDGDTSIRQSGEIERRLISLSAVEAFSKRSYVNVLVKFKEEKVAPFRTIGIIPRDDGQATWLDENVIEGEFFDESHSTGEVLLGKGLADELVGVEDDGQSVHAGENVTLLIADGSSRSVKVRGILDAKNFSPNWVLFMQKSDLEQMSGSERDAQLIIKLKPGVDPGIVRDLLQHEFPSTVVRTWEEESQYVQDIMTAVKFITLSIRDLLLVTVFFVVSIVIYIDVNQKRRQIGILKSMGTPYTFVVFAYTLQSFIYAVTGVSIGSMLFLLISLWSQYHPMPLLIGDFRIIETASIFSQTAFTIFISCLVGAAAPVWLVAKSKIIDDMRSVR